jgi:hypothetical protein
MTQRSAVDIGLQLGAETTPGTAVAANRKVLSLGVRWSPNVQTQQYRAPGRKYPGANVVHGVDVRGQWESPVDFASLVYPFAGYVGAVITTPGGGTNSRNWAIVPVMVGRDANQKTFTVQRGDGAAAQQVTMLQFNSITGRWQRTDNGANLTMSGDVFGRKAIDGQTLTAAPTTVVQKPAAAPQIKMYADTSYASIGTTLVPSAYEGGFSLGAKFAPFYAFDGTDTMADTVENAPPITFDFKTAHNAQSRGFFANLAANQLYFVRYEVTGPIIESTIAYKFVLDICGTFSAAAEEDQSGPYGYSYTLNAQEDATFNTTGGVWLVNIVNTLAAL